MQLQDCVNHRKNVLELFQMRKSVSYVNSTVSGRAEDRHESETLEENIMSQGYLLLSIGKLLSGAFPDIGYKMIPAIPVVRRNQFHNSEEFFKAIKSKQTTVSSIQILSTFESNLRSVEIAWGDLGIFKTYFVLPKEHAYFAEEIRHYFLNLIDFSNDDEISRFLLVISNMLHTTLTTISNIKKNKWLWFFLKFQDEIDNGILILAVVINFIMLISLDKGYFTGREFPQYNPPEFRTAMAVLVICQCALHSYKIVQHYMLYAPTVYKCKFYLSVE
jgi:hypothetical protein